MKSSWIPWSVLPAASSSETDSSAAPAGKPKPSIAKRKQNQQDPIANGVKSGQLTARETAKLERQQQGMRRPLAANRANGGKLGTHRGVGQH